MCYSGETLVVIVSRKRSEPLLSFCQLGPMYISDNTDDGKKDYEAFFPQEEDKTAEEILPEEPEKTSTLHITMPQCGGNDDQVCVKKQQCWHQNTMRSVVYLPHLIKFDHWKQK